MLNLNAALHEKRHVAQLMVVCLRDYTMSRLMGVKEICLMAGLHVPPAVRLPFSEATLFDTGLYANRLIGQLLKCQRLQCRLTHAELAAKIDLCEVDVARYERGLSRPSPDTLLAISHAFRQVAMVDARFSSAEPTGRKRSL